MSFRVIAILSILFLSGCETKKCTKWETKKEMIMYPMLIGMVNSIPQYTYIWMEQDVDYCAEYEVVK